MYYSQEELMLSAINRALTLEKARGNYQIVQNDLAKAYVHIPKYTYAEIAPYIKMSIMAAEDEVLYIGYKLEPDSDGEKDFIEALEFLDQKAQLKNKKITVRVVIDHIDGIPRYFFYMPVTNLRNRTFPHLDFQYAEHNHYDLDSFHQKQILIDNYQAILTSGEFSHANNYKQQYKGWREIATCLHGKNAVQHIRNGFIAAWNSSKTKVLNGKKLPLPTLNPVKHSHLKDLCEKVPVLYLHKRGNGFMGRKFVSPYTIAVTTAIDNAQHEINIMSPNINEDVVLDALVNAYLRGIKINILTQKRHNELAESLPFMGGTNTDALQRLINRMSDRGVEDFSNLNIRFSTDDQGRIVRQKGNQTLHAKLVIVDDLIIAGSSVLDKQSTFHSQEGDVCILSRDSVESYKKIFNPEFKKAADAYTCSGWHLRTPWMQAVNQMENLLNSTIRNLQAKALLEPELTATINNILGGDEMPNTLYHLQAHIQQVRQAGHSINKATVSFIADRFYQVAATQLIQNPAVKPHRNFFRKVFDRICDGLLAHLPGTYFQRYMSLNGLLKFSGKQILSKIRLFKPAIPQATPAVQQNVLSPINGR